MPYVYQSERAHVRQPIPVHTTWLLSDSAVAPAASKTMTSQGTPRGRAIHSRNVQNAEMAAREMGGLSLADAPLLCELLAAVDPKRDESAALRWLQWFIDERLPPLAEVALAASALAELRHGKRNVGIETLRFLLRAARGSWPRSDLRPTHLPDVLDRIRE
jgi:hypothetical protein